MDLGRLLLIGSCCSSFQVVDERPGFPDQSHHRLAYVTGMQAGKVGSHGENNIHTRRILFSPEPEGLPDNSFEAISFNHAFNVTMNTDAQSAVPGSPGAADQGETAAVETLASAVNVFEFAPPTQEITFEESVTGQDSRAQPFASPGATGLQDRPSPTGAHSFTKSVGAFALEIAGLKSSFAHLLLPRWYAWRCRTVDFFHEHRGLPGKPKRLPAISSPHQKDSPEWNNKLQKQNTNHMCATVSNLFDAHSTAAACAKPPAVLCFPLLFHANSIKSAAAGGIHEYRLPVPTHRLPAPAHLCLSLAH